MRLSRCLLAISLSVLYSAYPITPAALSQESPAKISINEVQIMMDDSVTLATDIYLPSEKGKFPCILIRSPYDKKNSQKDATWFAENGFAVVSQDTRGKFASEGVFYPFIHERKDGLATIAWINQQSWYNGKIGGFGGSYVGYTQLAIADHLDAITPHMTGADMYGLIYPGGLFSLATCFNWGLVVDAKKGNPIPPQKILASYFILPLTVADDSTFKPNQFLDDWLTHQYRDAYWGAQNHRGPLNCAVLSIGGWYDIFLKAQIEDFQALGPGAHPGSRLIIGPWAHGKPGVDLDFGGSQKTGHVKAFQRQFLAKMLKDSALKLEDEAFKPTRYSLFIMQRNEYFGCDQYPPKETALLQYYLTSANTVSRKQSAVEEQFKFTYDPLNPFPNKGGTFLGVGVGPAWQNKNCSRRDQVIFETEPLDSPLVLLGPLSATLYASTDAPSTDFIVCLQDVYPDSQVLHIQEGGTTIYSDATSAPRIQKVDISVWATGYQLNPGHKLRVSICSSWFPRFNRNLNSGEPIASAKTPRLANQVIYVGRKYPSHVTLPVLDLKD